MAGIGGIDSTAPLQISRVYPPARLFSMAGIALCMKGSRVTIPPLSIPRALPLARLWYRLTRETIPESIPPLPIPRAAGIASPLTRYRDRFHSCRFHALPSLQRLASPGFYNDTGIDTTIEDTAALPYSPELHYTLYIYIYISELGALLDIG